MGKKEVVNVFKIMAPGGAATPAPPLGPVLGSKGVNPGQFITKFNAATQHVKGKVVGCIVTVYNDKSFELEIKSSPASVLIKDAAKAEKGSGVPNKQKVGTITKEQVKQIAAAKAADLNAASVEAACRIIEGTARSMGVTVEGLSTMPYVTKRTKTNAALKIENAVTAPEAIAAIKKFKAPKFDQTVNVVMHLGVDTAQADQALRGSLSLPKGIGKSKKVIAFCQSDQVAPALAAGAIKAGGEELVTEVEKGFLDFDVCIASPDMMRVVSKLGKVLGPKGLMPSPKAGTVASNVAQAVKEYAAGKVEYRADKGGNVHAVIGKLSFKDADLVENLEFFINAIEKVKPATVKGIYIKKISISGAMTPGVQIKYVQVVATEE